MADVKVNNSKAVNRQRHNFDRSLNRVFKICSIFFSAIVAFTAIVGFFYVVLPLYQTKLLVEENAKSKLELDSSKKELAAINSSLQLAQNRLDSTNNINDSLNNISNSFLDSILHLSEQTDIFKRSNYSLINEIMNNRSLLNESYSKLRSEYSGKYWSEMYWNIYKKYREDIDWISKNKENYYTIEYKVSNEKYLTIYRPYYVMIDVINNMFANEVNYSSIPKDTIEIWKNNTMRFVNANKENLVTEFDFDKIKNDYENESKVFADEIHNKYRIENENFDKINRKNIDKIKEAEKETNDELKNYYKTDAEYQKRIDELEHGVNISTIDIELNTKLSEHNIKYMNMINEYDNNDIEKIREVFKKYTEMISK